MTREEALLCAPCRHLDASMCASIRYGAFDEVHSEIDPCECDCHQEPYDDDDDPAECSLPHET